ncbi:MAG TPA: SMC family ATPase [Anaerolineaceae bacterium]
MIPVRLKIAGFLSYRDQVELDFESFDLACISGFNGAGKSSLLDAMTWALFGQARRRDDALINSHATAAEVVFEFAYEGVLYRITRSKTREKTTLLEFAAMTPQGEWKSLTEKSVRETEGSIERTLRLDYETFTNASFFMQGKADQFAQQRPADRKRILGSILGLDIWQEYQAAAAAQRKRRQDDLKVIDAQIADIDNELKEEEPRKKRLREAEERLETTGTLRVAQEAVLDNARRLAASLAEQARGVERAQREVNEISNRCERLRQQLSTNLKEREQYNGWIQSADAIQAAYESWQQTRQELERWEKVAENFREIQAHRQAPLLIIAAEESRLKEVHQSLCEVELAVKAEQSRLGVLQNQFASLQRQVASLSSRLSERPMVEEVSRTLQQETADRQAENNQLKGEMNTLKERIERLRAAEGATCPLCGQELSPEDRNALLADLENQGKAMGDRFRLNRDWLNDADARKRQLDVELAGFTRTDEEYRQALRQQDALDIEIRRIEAVLADWQANGLNRLNEVNEVLQKGNFAQEARIQLAQVDAELKRLGYDAAAHDAVRRAEQAGRASEEQVRRLETAKAALAPLERQITEQMAALALEEKTLTSRQAELDDLQKKYQQEWAGLPNLDNLERQVMDLRANENRLRSEVGMVRQMVDVLDTLRERKNRLIARRTSLAIQVNRYLVLEKAFGKDGVPALLIEQALPDIEAEANLILDRLSAGGMSVRFETQREFKDKRREDKRETLDILIGDSAGMREYEMFSGGEMFRVNFAIRLALSRVLAQRAGARLQTLVIDEGFGSQDADGRQRLIEAINLVRGDFAKILVITHLEELKDAFTARIEVEKTPHGSRLRVVA